jgi:integrase
VRDRNVKWLDPMAVRRWVDVGLRGLSPVGVEPAGSRNRTGSRDAAFAEFLYGSGLRLAEAASVLDVELPDDADPARSYWTLRLAAACAKGGRGRRFWLPRTSLGEVLSYVEGSRALAVRRAQADGRYERLPRLHVVDGPPSGRRLAVEETGGRQWVPLDGLNPSGRRRLFRRTDAGLEPLAVWLNEDGLPRPAASWSKTFRTGNARVAAAGLRGFWCTPHMLRHSFALRWYAVGRLLWDRRLGHLSDAEQRDFRSQFGDTWQFVQTLLGHAHPQTTIDVYLEPFKSLDVELLLECAREMPIAELMRAVFDADPRVLRDPLGAAG